MNNSIKIIGIVFFLLVSGHYAYAQSFYDEKLYVFNWGYGRTNGTFEHHGISSNKVSVEHAPLTYEFFSRHAYFYSDILTPFIDLSLGAFNEQYWWGHERNGYIYNGGDWPLARLAIGGYFGNKVGLYAGGQWGYSHWKIAPRVSNNNQSEEEVGGHTFGPGIHTVVDFNKLMVRNSLMYDFVTQGLKGARYTQTFTWDIMTMYGITNDNMIGVFANYVLSPGRSDVKLSKFRIGLSIAFDN